MNARTFLILAGIVFIGLVTKNIFWAIVAGLVFFFYAVSLGGKAVRHGVTRTRARIKNRVNADLAEMEKTTGKYPAGFFDQAGKAITEKMGESMVPPGAKSYKDANHNYRWAIRDPLGKAGDAAKKFLDGLGKLFGK